MIRENGNVDDFFVNFFNKYFWFYLYMNKDVMEKIKK